MKKIYTVISSTFRIILLFFISALFCLSTAKAQTNTLFDARPALADTSKRHPAAIITEQPDRPKRFGRAAVFFGIAELAPFSYDRFIAGKDYAKISWASVGHNLNPGNWEFDNDPFQTNQFGHPYHGSLFYSAFRVNGYSFWQAAPAAAVGSYLWETFAENQAPAPNDFINTTFGGIVLGEMTYRLSNRIVNNRTTGFKRQLSEVAGFVVNPMNGLTRLLDGKWGKVTGNTTIHDSTKLSAEFDAGIRFYQNGAGQNTSGFYGRARLLYGIPFENYRIPFSNIYINAEFGRDDSAKVNSINVYGSIAGWELQDDSTKRSVGVLSANYDYIRNQSFFYGGQSVKMNVFYEFNLKSPVKYNLTFAAGPVILGAVPDPYFFNSRNYDYTMGGTISAGGGFSVIDKVFVNAEYRGGYLGTINGNSSHYLFHTVTGEARYEFVKNLSVCADPGYLILDGSYKKYPNTHNRYPFFRAVMRYAVNF